MSAVSTPPSSALDGELAPTELAAWRGFLRAYTAISKELDAELEQAHSLPLSSFDVLVTLSEAPGQRMRMCDLADSVLLSRSGLTRLVDRLERDGLLCRGSCKSDARGTFACLADAGRELLDDARPTHLAGVRRRFLDRFEEPELVKLAAFWERLQPGAAQTAP